MSYFQILILVSALFAFSYIIYDVGEVDAAVFGEVCCEETLSGNTCQDASADQCNPDFKSSPTYCGATDFCQLGCCVSPETGICNERTSRRDCEKIGGDFELNEACGINQCREGCCIYGNQALWTTEKNCEWEGNTQNPDISTEWRQDVTSEIECLFETDRNKEGACLYDSEEKRKCIFTTLEDCVVRTGSEANFDREERFCSDSFFNTTCVARNHTGCVDGEEDVYWFDSCGNKEDVSEDCDLYRGSYCGNVDDEYTCKDVDCDTNGDGVNDRKNGEAWCSYDGIIGNGKDPAGSRHMRHLCYMGAERLDPCSDFRNEICVEESSLLGDGYDFTQAACRVNQWRLCLDYNKVGDASSMKSKCEKNVDCHIKNINMAGSFKFDVCLPSYPSGFDLIQEDMYYDNGELNEAVYYQASPADGICDIATMKCTSTWLVGGITCPGCVDNCKCHTNYYTSEMNDFCTSLGDCGGYINYIGEYSDGGYGVRSTGGGNPGRLTSAHSLAYESSNQYQGVPANPGNFEFYEALDPSLLQEVEREDGSNISAFEAELLSAAGAYGSPLLLKILSDEAEDPSSIEGGLNNVEFGTIGYSGYTSAVSSTKAGIAAQIEYEDPQTTDLSMVGAMIGALVGYLVGSAISTTMATMGAMLGALLGFLLFMPCIIVHYQIYFTCLPWEPPPGGDKCNECNLVNFPCTEYRCESLGSLCHLINKGSGNEFCVSKPENETLPVIVPFKEAISNGFEYYNVDEDGFEVVNSSNKGCIEAYSSVDIGIKVDPFARCRIGDDPKQDYNEMSDIFGFKGNYILPAHKTKLFFPSPEAFKNKYNLTESQIEDFGKIDLYVKCKTASGKVNPESYHIETCIRPGPDLTPPRVTLTTPLDGSYLEFGTEEKEVTVYVNEPSQCRWSLEDKEYDGMENQMNCEDDPLTFTQFGWTCNTTITGIANNTQYYIRCRDTSDNSNTMVESYSYQIEPSKSELVIEEIIPQNGEVIVESALPVITKLKLRTSGGAKKGEAVCQWEGNGYGDYFNYDDGNGSSTHEYDLTNLGNGNYRIDFSCKDVAGNIAENSTSFVIKVDRSGPFITRVYYEGGLTVGTSEDAECRYDSDRNFKFDNASRMGSDGFVHSGGWIPKEYSVQCKDDYGNKGGLMKVRFY